MREVQTILDVPYGRFPGKRMPGFVPFGLFAVVGSAETGWAARFGAGQGDHTRHVS